MCRTGAIYRDEIRRIEQKLRTSENVPGAHAEAYGELRILAKEMTITVEQAETRAQR